jgi:hypothetical protein
MGLAAIAPVVEFSAHAAGECASDMESQPNAPRHKRLVGRMRESVEESVTQVIGHPFTVIDDAHLILISYLATQDQYLLAAVLSSVGNQISKHLAEAKGVGDHWHPFDRCRDSTELPLKSRDDLIELGPDVDYVQFVGKSPVTCPGRGEQIVDHSLQLQ